MLFNKPKNVKDLEHILLTINGATELNLDEHVSKIDKIYYKFRSNMQPSSNKVQIAKSLFDYLWHGNMQRFDPKQDNLLTGIDRQLKNVSSVGDCKVLTEIYSILGNRLGLKLYVLISNNHIMSVLKCKENNKRNTYIENTLPTGFDTTVGNFKLKGFNMYNLNGLIAASFNNRAIDYFDKHDFDNALDHFLSGMEYEPIEKLLENFFLCLNKMKSSGHDNKCLESLNKAIKIDKLMPQLYFEKGLIYYKKGWYKEAVKEFNKTLLVAGYEDFKDNIKSFSLPFVKSPLNVEGSFVPAYKYMGLANVKLNRHLKALNCFNKGAMVNYSLNRVKAKQLTLLARLKQYKLALYCYDKLLEKADDPFFYYSIATLKELSGDKESARKYFQLANNLPLTPTGLKVMTI